MTFSTPTLRGRACGLRVHWPGQVYYWEGGVASTETTQYHQSTNSFWGITVSTTNFNPSDYTASNPVATAGLDLPAGPWVSTFGAGATVTCTVSNGGLTKVTGIVAGGSGYPASATIELAVGGGTGGIVQVTTNASGVVTGVADSTPFAAGSGYTNGALTGAATSVYGGYTFVATNVQTTTPVVTDQYQTRTSHGDPPVFGYYTYDNYVTTQSGAVEYYVNSVEADYQIPISFIGSDSGSIDVDSDASNGGQGNIVIQGNITNTSGSVTLTSTHGSIDSDGIVTIKAASISLSAATGIGDSSVVNVNLLNGGSLSAITTTGGVDVNEVAGPLTYSNIESTGSDLNLDGQGNVTVSADGSITPASSTAIIMGNQITLTSNNGSIGTSTTSPVKVQAAGDATGGLTANASQNVYVEQPTGDLDLFSVSAFAGNVWLDAVSGNIIDHNPVRPLNSATTAQLDALYQSLDLGDVSGTATTAENLSNAAVELDAYLAGKTNDYQMYWNFRQITDDNGVYTANPYSANPQFTLTAAQLSAYEAAGWTAGQITAYVASQTAEFQNLQAELQGWVAVGGPAAGDPDPTNLVNYDPNFQYATFLTSAQLTAEKDTFAAGATWTADQLAYPIDGGTGFTIVLPQTPNVVASAGNVTLLASGGIGNTDGQVTIAGVTQNGNLLEISNWSSLSETDKAALATAEPADETIANGALTIDQRLPIDVEAAKGYVNASAGDNIYLASQNNDLVLDQVTSGTNGSSTVAADIKIKSADGIFQAPGDNPSYNVGSVKDINLILEAATTSIGAPAAPVLISATANSPLTAEAAGQRLRPASCRRPADSAGDGAHRARPKSSPVARSTSTRRCPPTSTSQLWRLTFKPTAMTARSTFLWLSSWAPRRPRAC